MPIIERITCNGIDLEENEFGRFDLAQQAFIEIHVVDIPQHTATWSVSASVDSQGDPPRRLTISSQPPSTEVDLLVEPESGDTALYEVGTPTRTGNIISFHITPAA